MTERSFASSWQTVIADLSLILFLVSAYTLDHEAEKPEFERTSRIAEGVPLAVWRDDPGQIPIGEWLHEQAPDDLAGATITVSYTDGDVEGAWRRARNLSAVLGPRGADLRVLLIAGDRDGAEVSLAHATTPQSTSGAKLASDFR